MLDSEFVCTVTTHICPYFIWTAISFVAQFDLRKILHNSNAQGCKRARTHTTNWNQSRVSVCLRWKFEWNKHKQYWMLIKLEVEITMRNTICFAIFSTWSSGSCKRRTEDNKKQLFKIVFRVVMRVTIDCKQWFRSIPKKKQLFFVWWIQYFLEAYKKSTYFKSMTHRKILRILPGRF